MSHPLTDPLRLQRVTEILGEDVKRCFQSLFVLGQVDQFWARTGVRTFFSWVEATTHEMKLLVIEAHSIGLSPLSEPELAVVSDTSWEMGPTGEPVARPRVISIDRLLRFVHVRVGRAYGLEVALPVSEHGWQAFKQVLAIRNRITHPKNPEALLLAHAEALALTTAAAWHSDQTASLLSAAAQQLKVPSVRERFIAAGVPVDIE